MEPVAKCLREAEYLSGMKDRRMRLCVPGGVSSPMMNIIIIIIMMKTIIITVMIRNVCGEIKHQEVCMYR